MFLKDFEEYYCDELIQNKKNHTSGNGLLYTAEYLIALTEASGLSDGEIITEKIRIYQGVLRHQLRTGLMMRTLSNGYGQNSIDDYLGCALLSKYLDAGRLANFILDYGKYFPAHTISSNITSKYERWFCRFLLINGFGKCTNVFNNAELLSDNTGTLNARSWLGRFFHLIGALKIAAGRSINIFTKIYIALTFLKKEEPQHHDGFILTWVLSKIVKGESFIIDAAINIWKKRVKQYYPTPGHLLEAYFADSEQPLGKWLKKVDF